MMQPFDEMVSGIASPPGVYVSAAYVACIGLWVAIRTYPKACLQAHYGMLAALSLVTFVGVTHAALSAAEWGFGPAWRRVMCVPVDSAASGVDDAVLFWMQLFHYSKYVELVDTIIILAKGRQLTFLHVFHHALVILQSRSWVDADLSFTWVGVAFNSFVHVFMYAFYALGASGVRVSWKGRITQLQIAQFVSSLGVYAYYAALHRTPGVGPCRGWAVSWFSVVFNVVLLGLFVRLASQAHRPTVAVVVDKDKERHKRE